METNNIFYIPRLFLLMRRQIFSNAKSLLIAFAGVAGFLLFISILTAYFNPQQLGSLRSLYLTVMFISGYIFTSNSFSELHQIQKSYSYLTLPVSTTERLAGNWLLTGIIFPLVSLLVMAMIIFIANLVTRVTIDMTPIQSIFSASTFSAIKVYVITHSIFLLGATYFRKNNFLKTILALFVVMLLINTYAGLLGWGLLNEFKTSAWVFNDSQLSPSLEHLFMNQIPKISLFIFNYLMLPFFLITTWFSIRERQV